MSDPVGVVARDLAQLIEDLRVARVELETAHAVLTVANERAVVAQTRATEKMLALEKAVKAAVYA